MTVPGAGAFVAVRDRVRHAYKAAPHPGDSSSP
jgi:hypothetical protein